jgi:hypothetical protein
VYMVLVLVCVWGGVWLLCEMLSVPRNIVIDPSSVVFV